MRRAWKEEGEEEVGICPEDQAVLQSRLSRWVALLCLAAA